MARKYFIETFGCQMNYHDSERLAGLLEADGYSRATEEADADLLVVNTCSVREKAEDKLYTRLGEIREARAQGRDVTVAVAGCVAQQEGSELFKRASPVDIVIGTQSLKRLPELLREAQSTRKPQIDTHPHDDVSFPLGVVRHADPFRASVTIIEGCNEYCSFCVVPYTRGIERMRPLGDILGEVRHAASTGRIEILLLGQIVNHYQAPDDPSCDFPTLLQRLNDVSGIERIRFASPHPRYASDRLLLAIRDLPKVCNHLHLPLQSGSNRVLKTMRRRYTREEYLALVDRARALVPQLTVSTDVIVGFPGETDEDFDATMDLVRRARYHSMYSFKYSSRPNTLAAKRLPDDVSERDKTTRILALQALQAEIQLEHFRAAIGSTERVLVDSVSRRRTSELAGRTSGNTVVNFPGPAEWLGRLVDVTITEAAPNSLRGRPCA